MFCQEFLQAAMWLCCAFVGSIASSFLLSKLGYKKGPKTIKGTKATVGSDAFRQEVAQCAIKTCTSEAAQHFGLSETEVQRHCSQFQAQQSSVNTKACTESAEETQSALEARMFTARSAHPGHVLLEHYDVFHPCEGAWSGPLEDQLNEVKPPTADVPTPGIPLSALNEVKAEQFFEGNESISLWMVPEGHVYDHCDNRWVNVEGCQ